MELLNSRVRNQERCSLFPLHILCLSKANKNQVYKKEMCQESCEWEHTDQTNPTTLTRPNSEHKNQYLNALNPALSGWVHEHWIHVTHPVRTWISTVEHWHKLSGAKPSPGIFILSRIRKVLVSNQCFQISVLHKQCFRSCFAVCLQQDVFATWTSHACVWLGFPSCLQVRREKWEKKGTLEQLGRKEKEGYVALMEGRDRKASLAHKAIPASSSMLHSQWVGENPFTAQTTSSMLFLTPSLWTSTSTSTCSQGSSSAMWQESTTSASMSTPGTSRRPTCTWWRMRKRWPSSMPSPATGASCRARAWCWTCRKEMRSGWGCSSGREKMPSTVRSQMFTLSSMAI